MTRCTRAVLAAAIALACTSPADAQTLRSRINDLFIFGSGQNVLHLGGTADPNNPQSIRQHGDHFVPAAVSQNGSIITFLTIAAGQSVANVPIGATSSGETFRFEGGVPVRTSTSAGPIMAERSQTLGRGRAIVGVGRTHVPFSSIRGQDLGNLELAFTHQNVDFEGCDAASGGPCAEMGFPLLENEIIQVRLDMAMDVSITSFYATYGLFDFLDVSFVLPIVSTEFSGVSVANIIPFGGTTATHFFEGTPTEPVLSATRVVNGSAFGVGDVAVRTKFLVRQTEKAGLAIVGDAILGIIGFDHLMAEGVTIAAEVISSLQVGETRLRLPQTVNITYPYNRSVQPTSIPELRDNIVDGSLGFKFSHHTGVTGIVNALVPLNTGGLRGKTVLTAGLEYAF
jgi:hypothetical protein